MTMTPKKRALAQASVNRYRDKMRREGLRLVQLWLPDISAPGFPEEFRRQALLVARNEKKDPHLGALLAGQDTDGWVP
jgi:hypothetical protein